MDEHAIRAQAAALNLPLAEAHLPGIALNLRIAARAAALVEAVKLLPAEEPAPVYRPAR